MRDKRFVAQHRGGLLSKEHHRLLMKWACACAEHILPLCGEEIDKRLLHGLAVAKEWEQGKATVGDARNASVNAHAAAREFSDPVLTAIARAVGHAVATAHMADHSLGAALYGLKALYYAGKSTDEEREWQNKLLKQLPRDLEELVLLTMDRKAKAMKII